MTMMSFCVCVPARNEAERLPVLLHALAVQDVDVAIPVALCVNNSTDGSMDVINRARAAWPERLRLIVDECDFPVGQAHVGTARGIAMDRAADLVDPIGGVLISTDADCRPPIDWISAILAAVASGADMVGGRIELDVDAPPPVCIAAIRARLDGYWRQVREIEDAIDPCAWDPAPRHGDHTGASLAITAPLYRRIGGVPPIATGEDRAMVDNGRAAGGRLAHPMSVWTRTSARTAGRAAGGMAEEMARLQRLVADGAAPRLPAFEHWRERARWRRALRETPGGAEAIGREEGLLPPMPCDMVLG